MIINGLTITVLGMLIVFGFLLLLVATMFALNFTLRKILPGSFVEKPADQRTGDGTGTPANPSDTEIVAAIVASINARIPVNRG